MIVFLLDGKIIYFNIQKKYNLQFDTLVADCEGCLCDFVQENRSFVTTQLRNIMFESDLPKVCDYGMIRSVLREAGFRQVIRGFVSFWRKEDAGKSGTTT